MTELQQLARNDPFLVFDGRRLHKKAFPRKVKLTKSMAALVVGKFEEELDDETSDYIIERMKKVKKGFASRIHHYVTSSLVETSRTMGMKQTTSGRPIECWEDVLKELGSNARMESFQNWYNMCYKERETKMNGKQDAESNLLKELNIMTHHCPVGV